ncbi:MAG: PEP-CTERM sorting domain-containing protein [Pontiellaceae bacterium]|jgi:hypothetical protein|nr:PEP-CTERM sorting domain-containing protein [Pontiellaceae bacterium]
MKIKKYKIIMVALGLLATASVTCGDVLFNNTSPSGPGSFGYFNPFASFGDSVKIAGASTINSITIDIDSVYSSYNSGSFTVGFYTIDAGTDTLLHTADDKIGTLIQSYVAAPTTITAGLNTISGFSIDVPTDFIYTVQAGNNMSFLMQSSTQAATVGTSYNADLYVNFSGALTTGSSVSYASFGNVQVRLDGVIPEPATGSLVLFVLSIGFLVRRQFVD